MEPTRDLTPGGPDWRYGFSVVLLALFIASVTVSGFIFGLGWGFLALGVSSGIASYLTGAE